MFYIHLALKKKNPDSMMGCGGTLSKMLRMWDHRFVMCCPEAHIHLWFKRVSTYVSFLIELDGTARTLGAPDESMVKTAQCPQQKQTSFGRSSGSPPLDHDGARHYVIHSSVMLEKEEGDEGREEESDGEVFA